VVDPKDPIPLSEAIERGLIPCSVCGQKQASVRKIRGQESLMCDKCASGGRAWIWVLAGLTFAVVALVVLLLRMHGPDTPPPEPDGNPLPPIPAHARDPEPWMKETLRLMELKRYADARVRIAELLEPLPKQPELNLLMGRCLMALRYYDAAIPYLKNAYDAGGAFRDEGGLRLGLCYKTIGHAAEALKILETPAGGDKNIRGELAEVYLDLERYDDALAALPDPADKGALWARHRALVYMGKADEAAKLLEGRDPDEVASLRAGQLREAGDFAGSLKIIETQTAKATPGSSVWHQLRRSERSVAVESGDSARLDAVAAAMGADKDPQIQAEAAFTRALAALMAGKPDAAKSAAWEFLAKGDKEFSPLRLEQMMMRHLVGELKDADLDSEAKRLSRFHANDLLYYLALATGDPARAEAALAATPGHNYPYYALRRLTKK
jgi:thioredoxin-like negative regulator of GroEL